MRNINVSCEAYFSNIHSAFRYLAVNRSQILFGEKLFECSSLDITFITKIHSHASNNLRDKIGVHSKWTRCMLLTNKNHLIIILHANINFHI